MLLQSVKEFHQSFGLFVIGNGMAPEVAVKRHPFGGSTRNAC